jgi:hypothetical protein
MGTIADLYEAFSQVKLREELPNLIQATSYEIDTLVISQLDKGELATGEKITPSYASNYYSKKKEQMNPTPGYGTPDIKYTGNLYKNIGVSVTQDAYDIESSVPYADDQSITQYGDKLLALSEENKEVYCEETLLSKIQEYITGKTGLIFE